MTHDHDDTPHAILTLLVVSAGKWVNCKFIDSDLWACSSALIWDFSQFIKIPLSKTMKTGF